MSTFYKTELGFRTIKLRDLALNAKQRRLLLLIGTDDFNAMNSSMQNRFATPELIQQLLELGLIQTEATFSPDLDIPPITDDAFTAPSLQTTEIQTATNEPIESSTQTFVMPDTPSLILSNQEAHQEHRPETTTLRTHASTLNELKDFMTQQLQQYCGLMAKLLIEKIHKTQHPAELKTCQMQWMTLLQESRIQPAQLNIALKYVNSSIHTLASD